MNALDTPRNLTISDVARELGVSAATVSMAFSGKGTITSKRREDVLKAARELGYEPNPLAQRLRGRATNTVAFYSPALDPGVTILKVQHIQTLLNRAGYELQLHARPYETSVGRKAAQFLRSLRLEKPRAIICNAGWHFGEAEADELQAFEEEGGIAACLSYKVPFSGNFDQVVYGGGHEVALAVEHLSELGHRHIGLASHDLESAHFSMERGGFEEEMRVRGLEVRAQWLFEAPQRYMGSLGAAAAQFLALRDKPTAMIVGPDSAASAFLHHLLRAGVQVPRDLSLVALGDAGDVAPHAAVPLTAVSDPYREHSEQLSSLLLERLSGKYEREARTQFVRGQWIERESTAPPAR